MEASLTVIEKSELARLEAIIEKGQQTFIEVGMALTQIRDSHLYRETYKTFEDYCKKRWEFTKQHAYRLIESIKTIENLKSNQLVTPPKLESQIRPLTHLEPEQQREVWQKAIETAPEGKVTARHVQNTVNEMVKSRGGDGKKDSQHKKKKVDRKYPKIQPRSNGMQFARMAIMDLEKITVDDLERDQALASVKQWIEEHERRN